MATSRAGGSAGRGRRGSRRFAAIAGPHGVHAVEYRRVRQGLEIVAGIQQAERAADVEALAERLADALDALGGRDGDLSLGLSGFGSAHHVLTLPDAGDAVLGPVVRRELLRYYPELERPIIDFVRGPATGAAGERKREVLVGAVPEAAATRLHAALADRRLRLRHLTVLPQVLQSVHDAFDGGQGPSVLLLLLETGPLIGCFHEGALRLFIEPPLNVHGQPVRDPVALAEQVERANLFLRQQFPAAPAARLVVGAGDGELPSLRTALESALNTRVVALDAAPAAALVALGAALSDGAADHVELLPAALRPPGASDVWSRRLAATAAAVVTAAALWWAGSALLTARAEADRTQAAEARVEARLPWLTGARELLEERRGHEQRVAFLAQTAATRAEVRRVLAGVASATGPAVRVERLRLEPAADGWRVELAGQAVGQGSAAAVRAVDALYRGLPARLPVASVELGDLDAAPGADGGPVALDFHMSFIVHREGDAP